MKIFLDTTELDNFKLFNSSYIKRLLDLSYEKVISIYISNIVLEELRQHFITSLKENIDKANNHIKIFNNILNKSYQNIDYLEINEIRNIFDNKIEELKNNNSIYILSYKPISDKIISSLLERYYEKKTPFKNNNSSWKDYIIWSTYLEEINANEDYCVFISNNTKDFCNGGSNFSNDLDIHVKKKDKIKFKYYKSVNDFLLDDKEYEKKYISYLIHKYDNEKDNKYIHNILSFCLHFSKNGLEKSIINAVGEIDKDSIEIIDIQKNDDIYKIKISMSSININNRSVKDIEDTNDNDINNNIEIIFDCKKFSFDVKKI